MRRDTHTRIPLENVGQKFIARAVSMSVAAAIGVQSLRASLPDVVNEIVGRSESIRRALRRLEAVAPTDAEVILSGPTGVGKELFARHIHDASGRSGEFVAINCGAIPGELFENEMFGHVAGAFTGARVRRDGLVAHARGGTLFLDEVHTLAPSNQVKLLRLLQEGEYRYLGEARVQLADVRIVAATNVDLRREMEKGTFRQDLFYRLDVVPVRIPALRERPEDIEPLLEHFGSRYAARYRMPPIELTENALARLLSYPWPGNVRELQNRVRCLTCLGIGRAICAEDLDVEQPQDAPACGFIPERVFEGEFRGAKAELVDAFERRYVTEVLARCNGNVTAAARRSGKPRRAFFQLMRRLGIDADHFRNSSDPRTHAAHPPNGRTDDVGVSLDKYRGTSD